MSRDFLAEIIARKRRSVAAQRGRIDIEALRAQALQRRGNASAHRLRQALRAASPEIKIIAEFKRRSPSAGAIRQAGTVGEMVRSYERGGAYAVSVLTDEEYFGGSILDLAEARAAMQLPLLCKDFIVDRLQLYQAAAAGADAVLLIVAALSGDSLGELRATAENELALDALIEVHTLAELERAAEIGAAIIGVNNRDLHTFDVSLDVSERLINKAPTGALIVSESGLAEPAALHRLHALGFDGFLIGEALMRASDPEAALRKLLASAEDRQYPAVRVSRP
ncbi:MAG TPA: indole-3-glycerol phosphate synthase TrpC [Chthoniobacterales bacterium]|nr:indole-3-glycerol phosphate synthase TrpC [Chthoniobacterales bacterium]